MTTAERLNLSHGYTVFLNDKGKDRVLNAYKEVKGDYPAHSDDVLSGAWEVEKISFDPQYLNGSSMVHIRPTSQIGMHNRFTMMFPDFEDVFLDVD